MTVSDIANYIKYGEFAQLNIAPSLDDNDLAIKEKAERQLLSYINLGLIEIYKRFDLRTEEAVITLVDAQTIYEFSDAQVGGYLSALPGTFNHVLAAYNEKGHEYSINDENDALSILTPSWNTVQVPNPIVGEAVFFIYNASIDPIQWITDSATTLAQIIPIPPVLTEALLHYIGYRGHGSTDGSVEAENNTHYMRFDASCQRVKDLGVITDKGYFQTRSMEERGWV